MLILMLLVQAEPKYEIGAYYFPNYHVDARNEACYGKGWTEWELVKKAVPRFEGHVQPKVPLWGYEDEAGPAAMEKKIAAAADHGLSYFIFDWYWYNDGPFLSRCLDEGYLKAGNKDRLKFCLMWANHDWTQIHPAKAGVPEKLLFPGAVTRKTFDTIVDRVIKEYFSQPSYWKIDGRPYFSIYELHTLIKGLGGVGAAQEALESFREKTKKAGFPDLHLNAVAWGVKDQRLVSLLQVDSITSYAWIHHATLKKFPVTDYRDFVEAGTKHWERAKEKFGVPFFPNVTMGWDSSPRTDPAGPFQQGAYPFLATVGGNTPAEFKKALQRMKEHLDASPDRPKIGNINAWNEWTEGSYLEPDKANGMAYLQAVKEVFGR
jgi:hypothetical protein